MIYLIWSSYNDTSGEYQGWLTGYLDYFRATVAVLTDSRLMEEDR